MDKYLKLKEVFEQNKDDKTAIDMSNYMKDNFMFYGIQSKKRVELEKEYIKNDKKDKIIDWDFLFKCYQDKHREIHYFVIDYLKSFSKYLTYDDLSNLEYFVKNNQWWDTIDSLDKIIGNIDDSRIETKMLEWSKHPNMWYRRLAINHQQDKKLNTNKEVLEKIIVNNLGSNEFFINKAIGWSLREYSKSDPEWVKEFLNKYSLDKLSIKEASKYI